MTDTNTSGIINLSFWIILYDVFVRIPVEFLAVGNRILQVFIEISKYLTPFSLAGIGVSLTFTRAPPPPIFVSSYVHSGKERLEILLIPK